MTVCAVYSGRAEIAPVCCAGSYAVTRASSIGEKKLARAPSLARVGRSAPRAPGQPPPPPSPTFPPTARPTVCPLLRGARPVAHKVDTSRPSLRINWTRRPPPLSHSLPLTLPLQPSGAGAGGGVRAALTHGAWRARRRAAGTGCASRPSWTKRRSPPPPPPFRTDWTRLVPPPVLTGHVSQHLHIIQHVPRAHHCIALADASIQVSSPAPPWCRGPT